MRARTYGGEVWTDAHGSAVVLLPPYLRGRELEYAYELEATSAEVTAVLEDARLTITSVVPHLKVAWRLTPRAESHGEPGGADTRGSAGGPAGPAGERYLASTTEGGLT